MKGKIIVIEGLDGSGKATQAELLYQVLKNKGERVMKVSFPDYESDSSSLIKMYLAGEFGKDPESVNAYAASTFYAVDRFASFKSKWQSFYESGGIIVADRYTTSNAVHQCAKLPKELWNQYLYWLYDFEFNKLGLPVPDKVLFLSVDPEVSQALMSERYKGDETKKDIHERNMEYLKTCRMAAEHCISRLKWSEIECTENGCMLSVEEISKKIQASCVEGGIF